MRPCPTCQCFVPATAVCCPRCDAALEPIESREEIATPRSDHRDRELVLVGTGDRPVPLTGSGRADPIVRSVVGNLARPSREAQESPAPRPASPKPPEPYTPDPLVLAVFLGIPMRESVVPVEVAPVEAEPEPPEVVDPPVVEALPPLPPDAFGALLGTSTGKPAPPVTPAEEPPPMPPAPAPAPPTLVAVPLAVAAPSVANAPVAVLPRPRGFPRHPFSSYPFGRRDPFARRATRRDRVVMRIFLTLALSLAALVVALRLPIGARPDVASSSTGVAVAPVSVAPPPSPFGGVFRMQTRADLRVVLTTASRVFPVWKSYVPAMPTVLERALPQFEFVHATQVSSRVGEMSVAASTHRLVLAEFAGPDGCTYARVIDRHSAETATRVSASGCRAASAPAHGWTALDG